MQVATPALPPYHPRVLQDNLQPLYRFLIPVYSACLARDLKLERHRFTPAATAEAVIRHAFKLLVRHQGAIPLSELPYLLVGDSGRKVTKKIRRLAVRVYEVTLGASVFQIDHERGTCSLHPEWAQKFYEQHERREARFREETAHWDSPEPAH